MRHRRFEGEVFLGLVSLYAVLRFLDEYIRRDYTGLYFGLFSFAQLVSLALVIGLLAVWIVRRRLETLTLVNLPGHSEA